MKVIFSPQSRQDLRDIVFYIAEDSPVRALSFKEELERQCYKISHMPTAYADKSILHLGLRMHVYKRYLIFFIVKEENIRIERIIHAAQDYIRLFDA